VTNLKFPRLLKDEFETPHVVSYLLNERSGQQHADNFALHIRLPEMPGLKPTGQLCVIKAGLNGRLNHYPHTAKPMYHACSGPFNHLV